MSQVQPKRIFIKGNEAIARGAIDAGCRCYFGYPITPQNDIPEYMSSAMPAAGGEFVQAESEVAAVNMLLGAGACGIRAMTSSSSPGVSLMQESLSYMAGSQIPGVVVNMNRGGPGLGDIGPSQGDYYQSTRGGGHGDYRLLVLAPGSVQEAYDMTVSAFDLAFKYRNPVLIHGDAIIGQMKEPVLERNIKKKNDKSAIKWSLSGAKNREHRILKSLYLNDGELAGHNIKLAEKYALMDREADQELFMVEDAKLIVVAFGSIGRIVKSTVRTLRRSKLKVGLLRPLTLYPFPSKALQVLAEKGKRFLTIEHNMGQMVDDVRLAVRGSSDSAFYGCLPGNLPTPDMFEEPIVAALRSR